jgi:hypothetical protein
VDRVGVDPDEHLVPFALTERQEFAFQKLAAFADRLWREVSGLCVGEYFSTALLTFGRS